VFPEAKPLNTSLKIIISMFTWLKCSNLFNNRVEVYLQLKMYVSGHRSYGYHIYMVTISAKTGQKGSCGSLSNFRYRDTL